MTLNTKEVDAIEKEISRHCAALSEMGCTSVLILTTVPLAGQETATITEGRGNFYAQLGLATTWVERQKEHTRLGVQHEYDSEGPA